MASRGWINAPVKGEFRIALEAYKERCMRVCYNNNHLCVIERKSVKMQFRELGDIGLKMSRQNYDQVKAGTWITSNVAFIDMLALYWEIPAQCLMFEDLTAFKSVNGVRAKFGHIPRPVVVESEGADAFRLEDPLKMKDESSRVPGAFGV